MGRGWDCHGPSPGADNGKEDIDAGAPSLAFLTEAVGRPEKLTVATGLDMYQGRP